MTDEKDTQKNVDPVYEKSKIIVNRDILRPVDDTLTEDDDEEFRCRDISPELCEKLRDRKFTNNRESVFIEVRMIEEQYRHEIDSEKEKIKQEIDETITKWKKKYENAIKNKDRELNHDIEELETEIKKSIEELEIKKKKILSEIDMVYKVNTPKLIEDVLKILGINYLCLDKN